MIWCVTWLRTAPLVGESDEVRVWCAPLYNWRHDIAGEIGARHECDSCWTCAALGVSTALSISARRDKITMLVNVIRRTISMSGEYGTARAIRNICIALQSQYHLSSTSAPA